jgi:hypothetical protein
VGVALGVTLAGILLAAIPVSAQSGLEHGHRLGTTAASLESSGEESADALDGNAVCAALVSSAGKTGPVQVVIRSANGSAASIVMGLAGPEPNRFGQRSCVAFETWAEQTLSDFAESPETSVAGIKRTEGKVVMQRIVRDNLRQIYASYTVTAETLPDQGTYRVSFGPPEPPVDMLGKADWKVFAPAKYPMPQIVRDEDTIRLELYSNGTTLKTAVNTTRRVVDYIHVGRPDRMVIRKETPHDYYADDAEIAVSQPRLRVNGASSDAIAAMPETIRGPVLWVYVPGHGRYILSLHAHRELGFEEAGEAAGNSLTFTAPDGNVFRIDTAERVAAGSGSYILHLLPDLTWEPADPQDRARVMIGASPGVIGAP